MVGIEDLGEFELGLEERRELARQQSDFLNGQRGILGELAEIVSLYSY